MKKITILVPCFNEKDNVRPMAETLVEIMNGYKEKYDYEIIFTDNCSEDGTKDILRELAKENKHIKVLMNNRNYALGGFFGRSARNTLKYASGDAIIHIACDFQEPPELIPDFIYWWEQGYKVVCGQKTGSKEKGIKYLCRNIYYKFIDSMTDVPQYHHMSGITLATKEVYDEFCKSDEENTFRHAIADMGYVVKLIPYTQQKRKNGKSSFTVKRYLTWAINSLVHVSTRPLRLMTVFGLVMSLCSFMLSMIFLVMKIVFWDRFRMGIAPIIICVLFFGSVQMFCLGVLGEYIGAIWHKVNKQPNVILSEKINIEEGEDHYR